MGVLSFSKWICGKAEDHVNPPLVFSMFLVVVFLVMGLCCFGVGLFVSSLLGRHVGLLTTEVEELDPSSSSS